jgi:hypothetical protein
LTSFLSLVSSIYDKISIIIVNQTDTKKSLIPEPEKTGLQHGIKGFD